MSILFCPEKGAGVMEQSLYRSPIGGLFDSLRESLAEFAHLPRFTSAFRQFERAMTGRNADIVADDGSDGPLALDMGGEALAAGRATRAQGVVEGEIRDLGEVSVARGEASFSALATGERGEAIMADADVYAAVSGADFVFTYVVEHDSGRNNRHGSWAASEAHIEVIAIDIEGFDFRDGPMDFSIERSRPWGGEGGGYDWREGGGGPVHMPAGHQAEVSAEASAYGDAALAQAFTDSFATDGLSIASGYIFATVA
ncbi:hypothetical protein [Bosea sp. LjRoot237]|uniref:hypothetical protein n=1 Tax=Bosea sp. LjRoot237 TaxID=3342292 RepID=UPI003ECCFB68